MAYLFGPELLPVATSLRPDLLVYHAYDLFESTPGWSARDDALQRAAIARAGLVFGSSRTIVDRLETLGASAPEFVPNGVDFAAFSSSGFAAHRPCSALEHIAQPRIGYTGRINRKVDLALIAGLASRHPNWQFVMVGPVVDLDHHSESALARCKQLSNLYFLGAQPVDRLPALVASMSVNLLAYRTSNDVWTQGIYPLKLHEYLAAGPPVVSADLPYVDEFRDVVAVAGNETAWDALIDRALESDHVENRAHRADVARRNDWSARVEHIDGRIRAALGLSASSQRLR
ncbi:MAG: glycosyltransferase [Pseudomonadota bacterium]